MSSIYRIGNPQRFQYNPGAFICDLCLRNAFEEDRFRIIWANDQAIVVRDKKNKHRYDIIKNVYS